MYSKILRQYLTISLAFHFSHSFFFATYTIFLLANGMNLWQIGIINAIFMATCFLLEIPTGALADTLGRKFSFVLSLALFSLGMFIYYFADGFWLFVLAEIVGAFGVAFFSGAWDAWAVDSLNYYRQAEENNLYQVFKQNGRMERIGVFAGSLAGGYMGNISLALPWLVSGIATAILAAYSFFTLKEEYFSKNKEKITWWQAFKAVIGNSVNFGLKEKQVFWLIALSSLLFIGLQAPNMYWNILFQKQFSVSPSRLGWVFAAISVAILIGNELSSHLLAKAKNEWLALAVSGLFISLGVIMAAALSGFWPILIFLLIHEAGRGSFTVLSRGYLQHRIPSAQRATIDSLKSMFNKGGAFIGLLAMGIVAEKISIPSAWLLSGALIAVTLPFYVKLKK